MVADRSRRNSGQYRTIAAHALLESYSVSLHINPLTCVSKSAVFLCNLTKNLTSQSAHPNLCGVALTTPKAQEGSQNSPVDCFGVGNPRRGFPDAKHKSHKFPCRAKMLQFWCRYATIHHSRKFSISLCVSTTSLLCHCEEFGASRK